MRTSILLAVSFLGLAVYAARTQGYCEHNYMRRRKNEKRIKRYGNRLSDHERRLREIEEHLLG